MLFAECIYICWFIYVYMVFYICLRVYRKSFKDIILQKKTKNQIGKYTTQLKHIFWQHITYEICAGLLSSFVRACVLYVYTHKKDL